MNPPKCNEHDYIDFLVATPRVFSCTEAARVQPDDTDAPAHDAINRLLSRMQTDSDHLWQEARHQVELKCGVLILDDSTLDKLYARKIDLVSRHWSGKHRKVVTGINLITLLWTDGERYIPCDYRLFDKPTEGATKNDHFRQMLIKAGERGFSPECVLFDSWYASLDNLKTIRGFGWYWLTQLKGNRLVGPDRGGNRALSEVEIGEAGRVVREEAILAGGSSGAVVMAIDRMKEKIEPGAYCVAILPDRGERYLDTIYSDEWVAEHLGQVSHLWEPTSEAQTCMTTAH